MPNFEVKYAVSAPSAVMQVTADTHELAVHAAITQAPGPEGKIVEVMQCTELPPESGTTATATTETASVHTETASTHSRSKSK